jgi:excisionase family DNA binding protein
VAYGGLVWRMAASPPTPEPLLLSIKDAALALGISSWTVYKLADEGYLESRYIGKRRLIPAESVKEYASGLPTARPEASA